MAIETRENTYCFSEGGARIIMRIESPVFQKGSEAEALYSALNEEYRAISDRLAAALGKGLWIVRVQSEIVEGRRKIKIKRVLSANGKDTQITLGVSCDVISSKTHKILK